VPCRGSGRMELSAVRCAGKTGRREVKSFPMTDPQRA
jgi:hypothetical protein